MDCAGAFDNDGCKGGLPSHAFEYIKYNGGLNTEAVYPYLAEDSGSCRFDNKRVAAYAEGGAINITAYDEDELAEAVYEFGPVSIAFQVVEGFKDYKTGIYSNATCTTKPEEVNHAVLAVGFGTDFWILKNSWNNTWGENGYFNMERGTNMCGIATCASYPNMG